MWEFAGYIIAALVAVAAFLFMPTPKIKGPIPEEFKAPTLGNGSELKVLFGTKDIKSSTLGWYGDVLTIAVRKKG